MSLVLAYTTVASTGDAQRLAELAVAQRLAAHPYELPAFHAVQALDASEAYAAWVAGQTSPEPAP